MKKKEAHLEAIKQEATECFYDKDPPGKLHKHLRTLFDTRDIATVWLQREWQGLSSIDWQDGLDAVLVA